MDVSYHLFWLWSATYLESLQFDGTELADPSSFPSRFPLLLASLPTCRAKVGDTNISWATQPLFSLLPLSAFLRSELINPRASFVPDQLLPFSQLRFNSSLSLRKLVKMKSFVAIAAFVGLVAAQDLAGEINNLPPCGVSDFGLSMTRNGISSNQNLMF